MGQDDLVTPVQPHDATSQNKKANAQMVTSNTNRPTPSTGLYGHKRTLVLSGTGREISHRNFQPYPSPTESRNRRLMRNAISSDRQWEVHSDHNLPITSSDATTGSAIIADHELGLFKGAMMGGGDYPTITSTSSTAATFPMTLSTTMPSSNSMTVLESPMITSPSFLTAPLQQHQQCSVMTTHELQQHQNESVPPPQFVIPSAADAGEAVAPHHESASLEDLMYNDYEMDADISYPVGLPPTNNDIDNPQGIVECPTGTGNNGNNSNSVAGASHAESGSGGQCHFITGSSNQIIGAIGGGGGGVGGGDDPYNNQNHQLQREHYQDGGLVLIDSDNEDMLRQLIDDFEPISSTAQQDVTHFPPNLESIDDLFPLSLGNENLAQPVTVSTPGYDPSMDYYSTFETGIQPIEESTNTKQAPCHNPSVQPMEESRINIERTPFPSVSPVTASPKFPQRAGTIEGSLDIIKLMNSGRKKPSSPLQPPNQEERLHSAQSFPSVLPPPSLPLPPNRQEPMQQTPRTPLTPGFPQPVQVSTPQQQQDDKNIARSSSRPPPSPATPPTPINIRPFDCNHYKKDGKVFLELLVRKDLNEHDRRMTLQAFYNSVQYCTDLQECMSQPCDLKIASYESAKLSDFTFEFSTENKLIFSFPSECKHLNKWLKDMGTKATFIHRHFVFQQVLNAMATVHNHRSLSLWGSFQVFVAPDLRVIVVPDILEMLKMMLATMCDKSFNPRYEDCRAIKHLFDNLIVPTVNQNSSWISPAVSGMLDAFKDLVCNLKCIYKMAEIARTLGEKRLCQLEVDYVEMTKFDIFCIEHEPLLIALTAIQEMIPKGAVIKWEKSRQQVALQDIATANRQMKLNISYS